MNILVITDKTLKDIIFIQPCVAEIRKRYSEAKIFLLYPEKFNNIVSNWNCIDEYLKTPDNPGFFGKWALISELRRGRFDKILDFRRDSNSFFMRKFLNFGSYSYSRRFDFNHYDQVFYDVMREAQIELTALKPEWFFPEGHSCKIGRVRPPLLGIIPFNEKKDVNIEIFMYIVSEFQRIYNGSIVIFGEKEYYGKAESFKVYENVYNLTNKEDYNDIAFVAKYCDAIVGVENDIILVNETVVHGDGFPS